MGKKRKKKEGITEMRNKMNEFVRMYQKSEMTDKS